METLYAWCGHIKIYLDQHVELIGICFHAFTHAAWIAALTFRPAILNILGWWSNPFRSCSQIPRSSPPPPSNKDTGRTDAHRIIYDWTPRKREHSDIWTTCVNGFKLINQEPYGSPGGHVIPIENGCFPRFLWLCSLRTTVWVPRPPWRIDECVCLCKVTHPCISMFQRAYISS